MNDSFDTLSAIGTELTTEQLDAVDGALICVVIAFAIGFAVGFGGAAAVDAVV